MPIFWPKYKTWRHWGHSSCLRFISILFLVLVVSIISCTNAPDSPKKNDSNLEILTQDGFNIPQFPWARDQLNYANSGLANKKEKQAALRAVLTLFPDNRPARGNAAIGLAYIHLETDYRFATSTEILRAVNGFLSVIKDYPDLDHIQVKAHWYLGWIYTELLGDLENGVLHYWAIVTDFPDIPRNLSVPVPWISLVYPPDLSQKLPSPRPQEKYWAGIALLEIIRYSPERENAIKAFDLLFDSYYTSVETGFALKLMLKKPDLASHALPFVEPFLVRKTSNPYLHGDIKALAGKVR